MERSSYLSAMPLEIISKTDGIKQRYSMTEKSFFGAEYSEKPPEPHPSTSTSEVEGSIYHKESSEEKPAIRKPPVEIIVAFSQPESGLRLALWQLTEKILIREYQSLDAEWKALLQREPEKLQKQIIEGFKRLWWRLAKEIIVPTARLVLREYNESFNELLKKGFIEARTITEKKEDRNKDNIESNELSADSEETNTTN